MQSPETSAEHAKDSASPQEEKKKPEFFKWPKRRRPKSLQEEAITFLSMCLNALDIAGVQSLQDASLAMPKLYRNYCVRTGLRGKDKKVVWNQVQILFRDAKSATVV